MNRRKFLTTASVGTVTVAGCLSDALSSDTSTNSPLPDTPTGSWTQYGADGANTSATDVSAPSRGNLAWMSEAFTRWQPVISDGTVYMTNFDPSVEGSALALNAQDGREQWRTSLGATGRNGTVLVDGRFIVAYDTELVGLDPQNGEQIWTQTTNGLAGSESLVADESTGTVLVTSTDAIEAYRAEDGGKIWETAGVNQVVRAPAIYQGCVYVTGEIDSGAPSLVGISLDDATALWESKLETQPEYADPVATEYGILVVDDKTLAVHDRETGERRHEIHSFGEGDSAIPQTVAADSGTVFVTSPVGVFAFDIEVGTERWHHDESAYHEGLCLGRETVIAPLSNPEYSPDDVTISAYERETGELRWYYALEGFPDLTIPPVLADGAVFFAANNIDSLGALGDVPKQE